MRVCRQRIRMRERKMNEREKQGREGSQKVRNKCVCVYETTETGRNRWVTNGVLNRKLQGKKIFGDFCIHHKSFI